jgi:hypothetical protein
MAIETRRLWQINCNLNPLEPTGFVTLVAVACSPPVRPSSRQRLEAMKIPHGLVT